MGKKKLSDIISGVHLKNDYHNMKFIKTLSRLIVGAVFIYSGFVKGIDPLGSTYKFTDYFTAFNLEFLNVLSFPLAIILSSAEFIIGVALLWGLRMKLASWLALIFMAFFTVLTFFLAIFNPVTDCGCFGDAIILTNWETFWKNLILIIITIPIFIFRHKYRQVYKKAGEWSVLAIVLAGFLWVVNYSYRHLPIVDFRPYNVGTHIPSKMVIPEGASADEYETILYYEKDGVVKEFTEENFPWQDTTWKFVNSESVLVKKGYTPPIYNFSITRPNGVDITDNVLQDTTWTFLLITYKLEDANKKALEKVNELALMCNDRNWNFYCLTSSPGDILEDYKKNLGLVFDFYYTDEITLKTIVRSNPGLLLLRKGTIVEKWHHNDLPDASTVSEHLLSDILTKNTNQLEKHRVFYLILFFLLFAALVRIIRQNFDSRK